MTLSDRDRKILLGLVPLLVVLGYWFLLLAPKRHEAAAAGQALTKQEQRRDDARRQEQRLSGAKTDFASDYSELVRLGKAVPTSLDMPSVLVQLDSAARGTGIRFARIATTSKDAGGQAAPASSGSPGSGSSSGSSGSKPAAAAGGAPAQTPYGKATEKANNTSQKADGGKAAPGSPTPGSSKSGGSSAPPGLNAVPLELTFEGSFFDLARFFHQLKRFVRVANDQVVVRGRLLSVDSVKFSSDPETFPRLKAELTASIYLSPKSQGPTAGATPQGPSSSALANTPNSSGPGSPAPAAAAIPHSP
jgi:Tfp pilus assembly protein PilO